MSFQLSKSEVDEIREGVERDGAMYLHRDYWRLWYGLTFLSEKNSAWKDYKKRIGADMAYEFHKFGQ